VSKAAQRPVDAEMIAAVANIVSAGYEVRPIGAGRDGVRRWAVNRPDPSTGSHYNPRSYFDRDGLVAAGQAGSKQGIRDAVAAAHTTKNQYITIREDKEMATKKAAAKKKAAKKTTAASERAAREAKAAKKPAATKAAKGAAGQGAKKPAARAAKPDAGVKRPGGADVPGATPEILRKLASYQEQTIERMNGARVVETYIQLSGSTPDNPVTHKSLKPYPARIARELARLGLVTKEEVPEVGLVYLPARA
jgi:primosomal protein N'